MDPSWCPGCDKLILPKRYVVPLDPAPTLLPPPPPPPSDSLVSSDSEQDPNHPPPPPAPTPVPSSPEVRKKPLNPHADPMAHRLAATRRAHPYGGGLVHGTGRVRPGGGLRPRPTAPDQPKKHVISPSKPAPQPKQPVVEVITGNPTATLHPLSPLPAKSFPTAPMPKKTRVVISQEPSPLYCSDECRARDLKNSFIESDSAGFAGAQVAIHRVAQMEQVQETVQRCMKSRRASSSSSSERSAPQPPTPSDAFPLPIPSPIQWQAVEEASLPPVPPNSLVDPTPKLFRTASMSSASSTSTASSSRIAKSDSKNNTIRPPASKARPRLPLRSGSFSTWGSPTKAPLAPPARTLLNASSSSLDSSLSGGSALFDEDPVVVAEKGDGVDTCGTTPSRRGSGSSGESKKKKRVSFASDSKPSTLVEAPAEVVKKRASTPVDAREDWRSFRRRRNPLLDANPLRDALSVSPKDRVKASSLPSDLLPSAHTTPHHPSHSIPTLCPKVVDTPSPNRTPRYSVAMWPEDEKRNTECARVHGELLRGYAKRFGPREGRSLVWGRLWEGREEEALYNSSSSSPANHDFQPDSHREYWQKFEEREAESRARRRAEAAVQREEEEKVISELLGGMETRDEDQPQARKMKCMAYDGMPGPAELRGLTYKFDRFLYPLIPQKPTIIERLVRRWDEQRSDWVEEVVREEIFEERKKLFKFVED